MHGSTELASLVEIPARFDLDQPVPALRRRIFHFASVMVRKGSGMFVMARSFIFVALTSVLLLSGAIDNAQAQAETPSNSCARELAACGTVHKGMFGVEYVTPEDAARCRAAYQACLAGQQNAQPVPRSPTSPNTHNVLADVRKFSIGTMEWEINGGVATFRKVYPGAATSVVTAHGTVSLNRIEGTMEWTFPGDPNCDVRHREHFVYVFDAQNVSGQNQPGPVELRGPCKGTWDKTTRGSSFTAPWRKVE